MTVIVRKAIAPMLLLVAGCTQLQELKIDLRNRHLADQAWTSLREVYPEMCFEEDFRRGFKAGYFDVASGHEGCPPVLPPRRYWSVRYMSVEGRAQTEAWFAGFRYGAIVAQQDGVGIFMELPTSVQPGEDPRSQLPLIDLFDEPLPEPEPTEQELPEIPLEPLGAEGGLDQWPEAEGAVDRWPGDAAGVEPVLLGEEPTTPAFSTGSMPSPVIGPVR